MHLLTLPPEIRNHIYGQLLRPEANSVTHEDGYVEYRFKKALALFNVNRQIYHEARKVFHSLNTFVRIETPWPDAKKHVHFDGLVHIISEGDEAEKFTQHTLSVTIEAPEYPHAREMDRFVILLEDLDRFCKSWFYSNLTMPFLNTHLTLALHLRDVVHSGDGEEKTVSKALQKRLFAPFGQVKKLKSLVVTGEPEPYQSVISDMKKEMDVPLDSAEKCLAEATRLKDLGNVALQAGRCEEALDIYRQAWLAMHIVVNGRHRQVHADQYFERELTEEPFKGQSGGTVRTVLRIRLVANSVLAYLKLEQYEMAVHTGLRTIKIVRWSLGLDENDGAAEASHEALVQFAAAAEMGKIYYRTALGYKALDDKYEARRLLKVAVLYLPNDRKVHEELQACALRIM